MKTIRIKDAKKNDIIVFVNIITSIKSFKGKSLIKFDKENSVTTPLTLYELLDLINS